MMNFVSAYHTAEKTPFLKMQRLATDPATTLKLNNNFVPLHVVIDFYSNGLKCGKFDNDSLKMSLYQDFLHRLYPYILLSLGMKI